jgi:hypothetical protein
MAVMDIEMTIFAVWTERHVVGTAQSVQLQVVERNEPFIEGMLTDARDYFWKDYIPRLRALQADIREASALAETDVVMAAGDGTCEGGEDAAGGSPPRKKQKNPSGGGLAESEKRKMKSLSRFIVMCADGAPVHIIRRFYDEEAEAAAAAAASRAAEEAAAAAAAVAAASRAADEAAGAQCRSSTMVSSGGFHFGKETHTVNGSEYGDIFMAHLIKTIRPSEGTQRWYLDPPDPRQRQSEEAEYCKLERSLALWWCIPTFFRFSLAHFSLKRPPLKRQLPPAKQTWGCS